MDTGEESAQQPFELDPHSQSREENLNSSMKKKGRWLSLLLFRIDFLRFFLIAKFRDRTNRRDHSQTDPLIVNISIISLSMLETEEKKKAKNGSFSLFWLGKWCESHLRILILELFGKKETVGDISSSSKWFSFRWIFSKSLSILFVVQRDEFRIRRSSRQKKSNRSSPFLFIWCVMTNLFWRNLCKSFVECFDVEEMFDMCSSEFVDRRE